MGSVLTVLVFPTPGSSHSSSKGKLPMGFVTVNIENHSTRPMSVNCWNDIGELQREPELDPKTEFQFRFAKQSQIMWDCTVMSIDDSGNMKHLSTAISKTFRAWINNDYPPHVTQALHSAMNAPSLSPGLGLCDSCLWKLTKKGIYLMEGSPGDTRRDRYIFAFHWDTRGHKRQGDPLYPGYVKRTEQSSHKVEIDQNKGLEKYLDSAVSKLTEARTHKVQIDQSKHLTDSLNGRKEQLQHVEAEQKKWSKNLLENGNSNWKVVDEETDIRDVQGQIERGVNKKMNDEL